VNASRLFAGFFGVCSDWRTEIPATAFYDKTADSRSDLCLVATNSTHVNNVDPLAWLADVLARIAGIPHSRLHELLPWEWRKPNLACAALPMTG
jgi:hypothetical protein